MGQHWLTRGRKDEAVRMFQAALATGVMEIDAYDGARAELKRLGY